MHRSADPWNHDPLLVRELSVCRASEVSTTDMPGAKQPDEPSPSPLIISPEIADEF